MNQQIHNIDHLHTNKVADNSDVHTIMIHADERMYLIGFIQSVVDIDWDAISRYTDQEIFDLYLHYRFNAYGQRGN